MLVGSLKTRRTEISFQTKQWQIVAGMGWRGGGGEKVGVEGAMTVIGGALLA